MSGDSTVENAPVVGASRMREHIAELTQDNRNLAKLVLALRGEVAALQAENSNLVEAYRIGEQELAKARSEYSTHSRSLTYTPSYLGVCLTPSPPSSTSSVSLSSYATRLPTPLPLTSNRLEEEEGCYAPPPYGFPEPATPPTPSRVENKLPASPNTLETKTMATLSSLESTGSLIIGFCKSCPGDWLDKIKPLRPFRACSRCHSSHIQVDTSKAGRVSLVGLAQGMKHMDKTSTCPVTEWRLDYSCLEHGHIDCFPLPGFQVNDTGGICLGHFHSDADRPVCGKVDTIVLRFGCGHFICRKCWRNYARSKLDNREILFDKSKEGHLRCPVKVTRMNLRGDLEVIMKCEAFTQSSFLFKALEKPRYEQYQKLGAEYSGGSKLTSESADYTVSVLNMIPPPRSSKYCPHCKGLHCRPPGYASRVVCSCNKVFCWVCLTPWSTTCQADHLYSL